MKGMFEKSNHSWKDGTFVIRQSNSDANPPSVILQAHHQPITNQIKSQQIKTIVNSRAQGLQPPVSSTDKNRTVK